MVGLEDIKKLRQGLNITQKDLARKAGVSQSLIAKIESGRMDPAFSKARRIIDALICLDDRKKAGDIYNPSIIFVSGNDSIKKAISKMKRYNISQMPVLDDKKMVGLVSEAIILEAFMAGSDPATEVKSVMKDAPPSITKEASLTLVTGLLKEYPMVVVMENGVFKGQITKSDIIMKAFR